MSEPPEQEETTVTTRPFAMTPKEYFNISLRVLHWQHWWRILSLLLFFPVFQLTQDACLRFFGYQSLPNPVGTIFKMELVILGAVLLFYGRIIWGLRAAANHSSNKSFMNLRSITFYKTKFIVHENRDGEDSNAICTRDNIFQVVTLKRCYLFFISPASFIYVPKAAFESDSEYTFFNDTILPGYPPRKHVYRWGIFGIILLISLTVFFGIVAAVLRLVIH